jgi:glucose uptake protein GlcU
VLFDTFFDVLYTYENKRKAERCEICHVTRCTPSSIPFIFVVIFSFLRFNISCIILSQSVCFFSCGLLANHFDERFTQKMICNKEVVQNYMK